MIQRLNVEYRDSARNDLASIFKHIVESGGTPDVALSFVLRIENHCQRIGDAPRGGRARDDLFPGLRTVPFEHSAIITYVVADDLVVVTNVFYGGRDFEALLRDEKSGKDA